MNFDRKSQEKRPQHEIKIVSISLNNCSSYFDNKKNVSIVLVLVSRFDEIFSTRTQFPGSFFQNRFVCFPIILASAVDRKLKKKICLKPVGSRRMMKEYGDPNAV
jgi:hypothetical protein